jgi:lauroyl/myristoyl acyltransferase
MMRQLGYRDTDNLHQVLSSHLEMNVQSWKRKQEALRSQRGVLFISIHGLLWDFRETGSHEYSSRMPLQGGEFPLTI